MAEYTPNFQSMIDLYVREEVPVRPNDDPGGPFVTWDLKVAHTAQMIIESGRGTSTLAEDHNNFAGLKWLDPNDGRTDPWATRVFEKTPSEPQGEWWRAFADHWQWLNGFWQFIETGPYEDPMLYATDPEGWIESLHRSGYATDSNYVSKVTSVFPEAELLLYESAQRQGIDPPDSVDPDPGTERFRLAIVVGHNHSAQGADSPWLDPEWTYNSEIARLMEKRATTHGIVARTFFRQPGGSASTEIRRVYDNEVNPWTRGHNALCCELHYNAGGGDGTEMLYWRGSVIGEPWARNLADATSELTGVPATRREDGIWGIRSGAGSVSLGAAEAPNCVVEPFFGDNKSNVDAVVASGGQGTLADAYLAASVKTAEQQGWISDLPPPPPPPPPPPDKTWDETAAAWFAETSAASVELVVNSDGDRLIYHRPQGGTE